MNTILVDTSVWIAFFRGREEAKTLFPLLEANQLCTNDLILAELIPFLKHKRETTVIGLLNTLERIKIEIEWNEIIEMQTRNLKNGINRVGIPDLIIAQNAIRNKIKLFSFDKHFELMKNIGLNLFEMK